MSRIRILPDQLANQIAAGEVVERPASVVKELVENSLDAGATRIEIDVEGGGTRLIRIIDDGIGMEEDDLLLSLERHGTSKITTEEDLAAINSLGFRGEALPSIGSVSKMVLTSRRKEDQLGTRVVLNYGKLAKVHEMGCSPGTTIEVRSLFGNTPARRKFLRTNRTEQGHIEETIKNYALARPEIAFILRIGEREILHYGQNLDLAHRLASILRYEGRFIEIEGRHGQSMAVTGYLVPPESVTTGPARLRLMVNGRTVRDRLLTHAVHEGLRSFLMKGRHPMGMIHLSLDPEMVDVNVHPAKHEVRFRQAREVHLFISNEVAKAMARTQDVIKKDTISFLASQPRQAIPLEGEQEPSELQPASILPSGDDDPAMHPPLKMEEEPRSWGQPQPSTLAAGPIPRTGPTEPRAAVAQEPAKPSVPGHNLLVLGQFEDLYIFCQSENGLVVIDQHAAHERILFERLKKQYLSKAMPKQNLLFPETVELSIFQSQLVEENWDELDRFGFSLRDFGGNTFIIEAIPPIGRNPSARDLFLDVLDQFGNQGGKAGGAIIDTVLATMACRAAVKGGTQLEIQEIDGLLAEMVATDLFSHCPHGRPVVKQFSREEIKKWFYRN